VISGSRIFAPEGCSGDPAITTLQLYLAFYLAQRKLLGTLVAQPEMLNLFFDRGKSKEPASIHTHEQLGAVRIGAFGNHDR
jgi:hypothetical protein